MGIIESLIVAMVWIIAFFLTMGTIGITIVENLIKEMDMEGSPDKESEERIEEMSSYLVVFYDSNFAQKTYILFVHGFYYSLELFNTQISNIFKRK